MESHGSIDHLTNLPCAQTFQYATSAEGKLALLEIH